MGNQENRYGYNDAQVHESISCDAADIKPLGGDLHHYTTESLSSYMAKSVRYTDDWAKDRLSRAKASNGRRCAVAFDVDAYP